MKEIDTNDLGTTVVNYGIILRGDLREMDELKKHLSEKISSGNISVIYQRIAGRRLWIKEGDGYDNKER